MSWTNYDALRTRIISLLDGDVLWLPASGDEKRDESRVEIVVCEKTQMTPTRWEKLDQEEREPWLEKLVALLTEQTIGTLEDNRGEQVDRAAGRRDEKPMPSAAKKTDAKTENAAPLPKPTPYPITVEGFGEDANKELAELVRTATPSGV